jgi:MFS family permease
VSTINWKANLAVLWVAQTLTMIAFSFFLPFIPLYVKSLGVESDTIAAQWAGFIVAAGAVSMTITQPMWGNLSDRTGRKLMLVRTMIGSCVFVFLMGMVVCPEQLVVVRFFHGMVSGANTAATALVATTTPKEKLGFALGTIQMGTFFGSSVGPLIGGVLADNLSYRPVFCIASAMQLLSGLLVLLLVREHFTKPAADAPKRSALNEFRSLLAMGMFVLLFGVLFLIHFGNVVISPVLSLFINSLHDSTGDVATAAGLVIGATGLMSAISALSLGRLSDKVGHKLLLTICLAGSAITYFPQAYVNEVWQLLVLRMALGIFLGGLLPSANALIVTLVPHERRGSAFGITSTAQSLATLIGPLSAIAIVGLWDMRAIFTVAGVLYLVGFVLVSIGFRRHRPEVAISEPVPLLTNQSEDL